MENDRSPEKTGKLYIPMSMEGLPPEESEPWNQEWFGRMLRGMVDRLLSRTGSGGVMAVFLCGSFATAEGAVIIEQGRPLFISDLDLVMVVDSQQLHQEILSAKKELGSLCEEAGKGATFVGGISVGVYHISELPGLPPSPLVLDMKERAVTLFGEAGIKERIEVERVSEEQGVRLLENRISAFLGSAALIEGDDPVRQVLLAYSVARVYTDILSVFLIFQGRYIPGYHDRLKLIKGSGESSSYQVPEQLLDKIGKWTGYKVNPFLPDREMDLEDLWKETGGDILHHWSIFRSGAGRTGNPPSIDELLGKATSRRSLKERIRRWSGKLGGFRLLAALPAAVFLDRGLMRFTPGELINLSGVRVLKGLVERGEQSQVEYPERDFRFSKNKAGIAAAELYKLWKDINK